jgi:TldD protein
MTSFQTAETYLLAPGQVHSQHLQQALNQAMSTGAEYADVYCEYTRSESWGLEDGIVKSGSFSIDAGFGIRAISGEKTAFAYADVINPESLQDAASTVRGITSGGLNQSANLKQGVAHTALYTAQDPSLAMQDADKVKTLRFIDTYARAKEPLVTQVMASLAMEWVVMLVARSDGLMQTDVRPLCRARVEVIVTRDGRRESGRSGGGGRIELTALQDETRIKQYVDEAIAQALLQIDARPAPAGVMPVVLGPGWPGILLHEAVGHGLEGDFNRKKTSAFAGRVGQQVAAKGVTVVDDGTLPDRRGSLTIDDEGEPSHNTVLIEDGILCGYIQDTHNARLSGEKITGNGRRESYACLPMPRMTNTYMLNGNREQAEMIASVKDGIFAVNFGGGQVDITNGKFVFSMDEAYRIENGKITYPVKGATLIGNGPDALTRVMMIGNDLALDSGVGVCGKDGQSVPVGVGQPSLRIDGLTVGGTA